MRLRFWGVRGAFAATGPGFLRTGGNTPCVEVRDAAGRLLVLDAGIGLYWLGRSLLAGPHGRGKGEVTFLLSHTHWDHIQGFPFFVPAFIPGNHLRVWGDVGQQLDSILEGQMNPIYSPIVSLQNMGSTLDFGALEPGAPLEVGGLVVRHAVLRGGGGETLGYRLEEGGRSCCYVPEVEQPDGGLDPAVLELARGADLLIHDAFYTDAELPGGGGGVAGPSGPPEPGHSSYGQATALARAAGVGRLLYFYHHPDRDDDAVEAAVAAERARLDADGVALPVDAAREGMELEV